MTKWDELWVTLKKGPAGQFLIDGPYSNEELKTKVATGVFNLKTWVWRRGLKDWTQLCNLKVISDENDWNYEALPRQAESFDIAELRWAEVQESEDSPLEGWSQTEL